MDYKYEFSVVIPIYNVENYLQETIESVINQDIGFKDNIQIILVNDGSPDNSEEICLKYRNMYPENIIYVKQENAGVSAARNTGMEYIEGEYVNFLDSDDKWSSDAFSIAYKFFQKNKGIDVVACRKKFFEAEDNYHIVDYFFKKDKNVDIFENYNYCHMHAASSFIKSDIAKEYKFSTNLKYGEDAEYINKIILNKERFGVSSKALYYYRKRLSGTSAIQNTSISKEYYTKTLGNFHKSLIDFSMQKYDEVIPYIQYVIMYDLQWRIKQVIPDILTNEEKENYKNSIIEILQYIDDHIICEQRNIYSEHKLYALCLKYQRDIRKKLDYRNSKLYFNNL
ncbi:MAG: glycosyltransferase family 2 protein, partial [Clostridiales bacterium]|nr:glycosyltransferase family 2 protein [Clostridiales bacterium]